MTDALLSSDIIQLATRVVEENREAGRTIALAESCTGGLVCGAVTEIAGSSSVLDRGFITYSNEAKMELLGVSSDIIETFGAVSIACVWVGTVVFARATRGQEDQPEGELKSFGEIGRAEVRRQATLCALELLLP